MSWELHYSLSPEKARKWGVAPSSNNLEYFPFATLADAQRTARAIAEAPESMGHAAWLQDAQIWAEPVEKR